MLRKLDLVIARLPRVLIVLLALLAIGFIGVADWYTGFQISLSILYIGPVALTTWYAGKRPGILMALLSTITWLAADVSSGLSFAHPIIPAWNALVRFGVLFITATLLDKLRDHLEIEQRLARTDALTGVANRRTFMEQLGYGLALAGREGRPFAVALVDLDDFKSVNDTHGHSTGDKVLQTVARTLSESVRSTDIVARLGGDEFALFLPDTDSPGVKQMLKKMSRALGEATSGRSMPTCSIGAVTFLSPPTTAEEAIKTADFLMYDVKKSGKSGIAYLVVDPRPRGAA